MYRLRLTLLGRMQAVDANDRSVLPRSRKARAVLALLALAAPNPVLRQDLTDLLWSRRDKEQARASLRQCVHELQTQLQPLGGGLLLADRHHLALRVGELWIDAKSTDADHPAGPLLEDLVGLDAAFDRWLLEQRDDPHNLPARLDARPRSQGARLCVLPFRTMPPAEDDPLSFSLADEITTALSRFRWLSLIAPTAPPAQPAVPRDDHAYWRALDVDFLLDGSVQRGPGKVHVMVRLRDLRAGGEIVWSGSFDRAAIDILTLQHDIAAEAVARLDPELLLREGRRVASGTPSSATAYELTLRALPAIYRLDETAFRAAGAALAAAVALDPDYAAAHAWWACWHIFLVGQGWAKDRAGAIARATHLAERAMALDPFDARGLTIAGHVHAFLHRRVDDAFDLHARALALNPNLPLAWTFSGLAECYAGRHEEAIRRIRHAERLSPFDPHAFFFDGALLMPLLLLGRYEEVLEVGRRAIVLNPALTSSYKCMLSALGHLGRHTESAPIRDRLLQLDPSFGVREAARRSSFLRDSDNALYADGLRRGGLRE